MCFSALFVPGRDDRVADIWAGEWSDIYHDFVMDAANASLGTDGYTVASGTVRTYQEALKNALDKANNNLNFLQTAAQCQAQIPPAHTPIDVS